MDNQITLIGATKLLKNEDFFILRYLAKNKKTSMYETREIACMHTKETKCGAEAIRSGQVLIITGQIISTKVNGLVINPISYHVIEQKTMKKESAYLIKFGTDYNRIQLQDNNQTGKSGKFVFTHPVPPRGKVGFDGVLDKDKLEDLSIPIYKRNEESQGVV